ncbi:MAG: hypothetical protein M1833_002319 [Piccolia ochrophora]|nr:MAG: hypothetical protein M1833_002319 [Piccolia ochrophora]
MDSPVAPSTPDPIRSSALGIRRAFTLPTKLKDSPRSSDAPTTSSSEEVEILFSHNAGKVVSFSPASTFTLPSFKDARRGSDGDIEEEAGTLPWASRTERMLATGPLQFYKAHSVAFLSAGPILHPILPKSQCWCVDGVSKFVLRIRYNSYYRIELSNDGQGDSEAADALKGVLAKVLQYEKTSCPFKRGFTVDLPEPPSTPIKYRPWKPRERPHVERSTSDRSVTAAEDDMPLGHSSADSDSGDERHETDDTEVTPRAPRSHSPSAEAQVLRTPTRARTFAANRSITAPPQLLPKAPEADSTSPPVTNAAVVRPEVSSVASAAETFHSFHSPISPFPPSPPKSPTSSVSSDSSKQESASGVTKPVVSRDDALSQISAPETQPSKITETSLKPPTSDETFEAPSTPRARTQRDRDSEEESPSETTLRQVHATRKRAVDFIPQPTTPRNASSTLILPTSPTSGHHLTTAIIQKTCSLMLMTPAQLFSRILTLARRIASGALQGVVIGIGESGERIPCQWESSDTSDTSGDDDWEEDDYGVSLGNNARNDLRRRDVGGSWEID